MVVLSVNVGAVVRIAAAAAIAGAAWRIHRQTARDVAVLGEAFASSIRILAGRDLAAAPDPLDVFTPAERARSLYRAPSPCGNPACFGAYDACRRDPAVWCSGCKPLETAAERAARLRVADALEAMARAHRT